MTTLPAHPIAEAKLALDTGNFEKARELLDELVEQGDPEAMFLRAQFGLPGEDEILFERRHIDLLKRAEALGHAEATYQLSTHLEAGDFVAPDPDQALSLLQRAANLGHPH